MTEFVGLLFLCTLCLLGVLRLYVLLLLKHVSSESITGRIVAGLLFLLVSGCLFASSLIPIKIWRGEHLDVPVVLSAIPPLLGLIYLIVFENARLSLIRKRFSSRR